MFRLESGNQLNDTFCFTFHQLLFLVWLWKVCSWCGTWTSAFCSNVLLLVWGHSGRLKQTWHICCWTPLSQSDVQTSPRLLRQDVGQSERLIFSALVLLLDRNQSWNWNHLICSFAHFASKLWKQLIFVSLREFRSNLFTFCSCCGTRSGPSAASLQNFNTSGSQNPQIIPQSQTAVFIAGFQTSNLQLCASHSNK